MMAFSLNNGSLVVYFALVLLGRWCWNIAYHLHQGHLAGFNISAVSRWGWRWWERVLAVPLPKCTRRG